MHLFAFASAFSQSKIKDGTVPGSSSLPNSNAILDLESSSKGMLIPRLQLISTTSPSPLSAHVRGMVVYNTAEVNDVDSGLYINDGTKWSYVTTAAAQLVMPKAAVVFYDDTTGVTVYGNGTSPNGTAYSSTTGVAIGSYISPATASRNIDSIKKVGTGVYKIFFHPGTFPDNNYNASVNSSDGVENAGDDAWQTASVPYEAATGGSLGTSCTQENEPQYTTPYTHYITKTKNYCYVTSSYGGLAYNAAYVSVIFFR